MGPVDERVLAAFSIKFSSAEDERRFIKEANERFMVQVGTEISKKIPFERIEEYRGLTSENVSGCILWMRENASPEQLRRLLRGGTEAHPDIARAARILWLQKNCPECREIVFRVWRSFCGELRQTPGKAGGASPGPD